MKGSEKFLETIQNHLLELSNENKPLEEALDNVKKNMQDCIAYIFNTVKKSGLTGFDDQEIYDMAIEYYLTDEIEIGDKNIQSQVIVNRMPILTEEEKAQAKQKAIEELIKDEKQKITKKSSAKSTNQNSNPTLF